MTGKQNRNSRPHAEHAYRIHMYAVVLGVAWTCLVATSFAWYQQNHHNEVISIGRAQAVAAFGRDLLYRRWGALHGGVYVPVTPETPPNPYLAHVPERDIATPSGRALTLINPAYMTRQVYEMAHTQEEVGQGHITSLKPLRPENRPDPWEEKALHDFERGFKEASEIQELNGKPYMRLMRPVFTDKRCLKCHAAQGYREGDIRGGVSVAVPISTIVDASRRDVDEGARLHLLFWALGLGMLGIGSRKLSGGAMALHESEQRVQRVAEDLHAQTIRLEEEVAERQAAQEALQEQAATLEEEIAERQMLQAQLLQAQKMESVGRLAGGVAHDFNNMLTVILGYAEISRLGLPEWSPVSNNLKEITKAAEHSRDITRQLLAFSRKEIISPKPVDLNTAIIDTQKTLARLIGEDITLRFHPGNGLWTIMIDPSQVDQIFVNLAINARDAMPGGGSLTIATCNIHLDEACCHEYLGAKPGDYVQLTVSDSGFGMDRETLEHIFEPFFTTKEFGKGTGLGLATVYGIVTQNNGFINVYSEPGQGATFKVYFPRMTGGSAAEPANGHAPLAGSGTVLLVEDDDNVRRMTKQMLETIGYTVLGSNDPLDALAICENMDTRIDLVLTDVIMPGMSGREMQEKMALLRPGIRVLFMSGYTSDVIAERGVLAESIHFMQKPFDIATLNAKISETLQGG